VPPPQTLAVPPPPQVWGDEQLPQLETVRALPQLSVPLTCPQLLPSRRQKAPFDSGAQETQLDPAQTLPDRHWLAAEQLVPQEMPLHR
jgi:hypothetical protein